jgi:hypothetical protein
MITITPEMTAEQLCSLSENLKTAIVGLAFDLKKVNDAIVAKKESHETEVANLKARHEAELARLIADNEDMTEIIAKNTELISAVEKFIA